MKLVFLCVVFGLSAPAQTKAPVVTQARLDTLTSYWQGVLKLNDWEIRTRTVRLEDLGEGELGGSTRTPASRLMTIRVLDPRDYAKCAEVNHLVPKSNKQILRDIEDTIIHEIMHLRLRELVLATEYRDTVEETLVNRLTSGLLTAKYGH